MSGTLNAASFPWDDTRYAASHTLRSYLRSILMHEQWNSEFDGSIAHVRIGSWAAVRPRGAERPQHLQHLKYTEPSGTRASCHKPTLAALTQSPRRRTNQRGICAKVPTAFGGRRRGGRPFSVEASPWAETTASDAGPHR